MCARRNKKQPPLENEFDDFLRILKQGKWVDKDFNSQKIGNQDASRNKKTTHYTSKGIIMISKNPIEIKQRINRNVNLEELTDSIS